MENILNIFSLGPGTLFHFFIVITILFFINDILRTYWFMEHTKSVAVHVAVVVMTLVPAILMIAVILYSASKYPDRAWLNLIYVLCTFIPWYLAGKITTFARADSEGADVGFMFVGFLIVSPIGVVTALLSQ